MHIISAINQLIWWTYYNGRQENVFRLLQQKSNNKANVQSNILKKKEKEKEKNKPDKCYLDYFGACM